MIAQNRWPAWLGLAGMLLGSAWAAQADPPAPSGSDKCPVCGMFVAKFPDWIGFAAFRTGRPVYADGVKDLLRYLQDPGKHTPGRQRGDLLAVHFKDYYHLRWIEGREAFYVAGSDVFGPMGRELIPLATAEDAKAFLAEHHGKRILRFQEITRDILQALE